MSAPERLQLDLNRPFTWILPGGVLALTAVCFLPALSLFFAQDDFRLMQRALNEPGWGFEFTKHHYRPLTKYVYFAAMYKMFGLKPFMYHLVSLAVHVVNTLLVYRIVGRLGVRPAAAVVTSALFGMSVAFLHAVAWVSCIQQLAGGFFFLLCFWSGLRALQERTRVMGVLSAIAYLLAVLSLEQPFAAGPLLVAAAMLGVAGRRFSTRDTVAVFWPHLVIFAVYTLMRLFKGVPDAGLAGFTYGKNIFSNMVAYLGGLTNPWPVVSSLIAEDPLAPRLTHGILAGLVVYHLFRRRFGPVVFAVSLVVATLVPALFLVGHQFYYHIYVPALGIVYLTGLALNDLLGLGVLRVYRIRLIVVSAAVATVFFGSFLSVRAHFRRASDPRTWNDASFVIRRARIARRIHGDIVKKASSSPDVRAIRMIYFNGEKGLVGGHHRDTFWALANGATIAMSLGDPTIEVVLDNTGRSISQGESITSRIFLYDREGHVYTLAEVGSPTQ